MAVPDRARAGPAHRPVRGGSRSRWQLDRHAVHQVLLPGVHPAAHPEGNLVLAGAAQPAQQVPQITDQIETVLYICSTRVSVITVIL